MFLKSKIELSHFRCKKWYFKQYSLKNFVKRHALSHMQVHDSSMFAPRSACLTNDSRSFNFFQNPAWKNRLSLASDSNLNSNHSPSQQTLLYLQKSENHKTLRSLSNLLKLTSLKGKGLQILSIASVLDSALAIL